MSYNGRLGFGLLADYDALPDLEDIAQHLDDAIESLAREAGVGRPRRALRHAGAAQARSGRGRPLLTRRAAMAAGIAVLAVARARSPR